MGALEEGHHLENVLELGSLEAGDSDTFQIEEAVKILLHGLGEDVNREGLKKTPLRVAKALREGTKGYKEKVKDIILGALFPEAGLDNKVGHAGGAGGLVIVRDLDLFSYCESCLLPFQVKCHVGYVPSGLRVVGLSKLSRVASVFAKRLQHPQRLADEICSALHNSIKPAGVAIVLQCLHINFPSLESILFDPSKANKGWEDVLVSSGSGVFEDNRDSHWSDFITLLKLQESAMDKIHDKLWCPSLVSSDLEIENPALVSAVSSIIGSLGEDPSRKELVGTPTRFLEWLMNFKNVNFNMKLNGFVVHTTKIEFPISNGSRQIRTELNLPFWSQCEHHLLPFHGVVHIGFLSADEDGLCSPIGKSLLQSIVHFYGLKLQVQERLTRQIAETVATLLGGDVMVVAEASHTCMISRGIEKFGSSTATVAVLGLFANDPGARTQFLQSIPRTT